MGVLHIILFTLVAISAILCFATVVVILVVVVVVVFDFHLGFLRRRRLQAHNVTLQREMIIGRDHQEIVAVSVAQRMLSQVPSQSRSHPQRL